MNKDQNYHIKNNADGVKKPLSSKNHSHSNITQQEKGNSKERDQNVSIKPISEKEFDEFIKQKLKQTGQIRAQTAKYPTHNQKNPTSFKQEQKQQNRDVQSAVLLNQQKQQNLNKTAQELPQIQRKYQIPAYSATTSNKDSDGKVPQFFNSTQDPNTTKNKLNRNWSASSKFTLKQFSLQKYYPSKQAPPLVINLEPEDENYDDLRDKLWDQVYFTKNQINELNQDNSNLRAKVWNIEKENRKMIKQIDNWNLNKGVIFDEENKPFVDSATSEKVFIDQNFQAISMKKEIKQLQEEIYEQDLLIKDLRDKIKIAKEDQLTMKDQLHETFKDTLISSKLYQIEKNPPSQQQQKLENKEYRLELLLSSIREIMEKNRVKKFMIDIQQQTFEKSQEELIHYTKKLKNKEEEEDDLENELKERIPHGELKELPQKNQRKMQNRISTVAVSKNIDEQLEEKDQIIEEQMKDIQKINYDMQEITRNSILEKQDLMREINAYKEGIQQFEEKYLILQSRHSKRFMRNQQKKIPNNSNGLTYFGSNTDFSNSIHAVPDYIVKENQVPKSKNPLSFFQ